MTTFTNRTTRGVEYSTNPLHYPIKDTECKKFIWIKVQLASKHLVAVCMELKTKKAWFWPSENLRNKLGYKIVECRVVDPLTSNAHFTSDIDDFLAEHHERTCRPSGYVNEELD